jgi:predicted transcriptional regulator
MAERGRGRGADNVGSIQGELQAAIMPALWRLQSGTVEQVRAALPRRYQSAYNTVQTVLNRLVDRGLLHRERQAGAYIYTPRLTEAEYLERSINRTLAGASGEARRVVLANLVGGLDQDELSALREVARRIGSPQPNPERRA